MQGAGCRVQGAGCRVQGAGFRVQGRGLCAEGSSITIQGSGCRVQGAGLGGEACTMVSAADTRSSWQREKWRRCAWGVGFGDNSDSEDSAHGSWFMVHGF